MRKNIYELIEVVRARPAMFFGSASISRLDAFLHGYRFARIDAGIEENEEVPPFGYFHDWVAMKLGKYEGTAGWCSLLLESTKGDEQEAFLKFFEYLDEFRRRNASVIMQGVVREDSQWAYELDPATGERRDLERPLLLQIVKYTNDEGVFTRYLGPDGGPVYREEHCKDIDVAYWRTDSLVGRDAWQAR